MAITGAALTAANTEKTNKDAQANTRYTTRLALIDAAMARHIAGGIGPFGGVV